MGDILTKYTADEVEEAKGKIKRIEVRKKEYRLLKEKLEEHFNFKITDYIIDDILDYETYRHTCLMINLAVINNRISIDNGEILKAELRTIFKIKNEYDRFNRNVYIDTFDFDSWYSISKWVDSICKEHYGKAGKYTRINKTCFNRMW